MTPTMVDTKVLTKAVELACRAPSLHNSQPWRWVAGGPTVDLFADPHRMVPSADSSGRESIISCGAVLDHFRVAMAADGWESNVDEFPNPNNLDHLASIDFVSAHYVAVARRDRAAAILRRRTDRRPFGAPRDWASFEPVLRSAFNGDVATLDVLADNALPLLVEAARLNEALRRYDDLYQHELRWWTAPGRHDDGIPEAALVNETQPGAVDVNRRFPAEGHTRPSSAGLHDQAKVLVLSTPGDTRADAFRCGQALSAILLECTMAGMATCTVTHVTELQASRDMIRELISDAEAVPQVLIRVGTASAGKGAPEPTPRRPIREVLEMRR
ncbi:Acg family FMN-binding oxidoreductase [Mycobacterium nebraskense]|uniref:NAD(P)H nitroreductase n=1 Tax=Mycobacterium nebraskense TaxID=244292 RepID=A0A0F5N6L2_9MYCO|nr:NAD(P)H nitroreductase [Mycobacterium nebraskense]KKC02505.1 NAD(P)H nitroreductase [Mycobacterium nebraskense]KLO39678.1 NAD(P)H nitroreductase [Mycobacterium nebraskense]MBI2695413.1 NAD(P)H nitroreductase [Mycobacterium nebraskense]MCV7121393.1 NAD(P)H nitroreductase [Mycobacterium nebraskense]ORW30271.1 NAD(P)H nitroreductase [Mycobacterium nebraskense]